jgi:hypothetical protein
MRELVTTLLDTLGLLLVAAGAGFGAGRVIGWSGLAVSGVVVLAGSALAARVVRPSGGRR